MGNRHKVGDHKRGGKTDRDAEQRRVRHQHWKQRWWKRRDELRAERLALEDTEPAG